MTFSIKFLSKSTKQEITKYEDHKGIILLNAFQEHFDSSLSFWSITDYKNQWKQGLNRIVDDSLNSCLITSMYDPTQANFIFWWVFYPTGDVVFVQNQILFLDQLDFSFNASNPYSFIPRHKTTNDDGDKISEWTISIQDIKDFLKTLKW